MSKVQNDQLMAKRLIRQTLTNWVNPELERRKTEGKLGEDFVFKAAQVMFSVGGPPVVRINSEVRAIVEAKINRSIQKGEKVLNKDIEDIRAFKLVSDDKDFGHITLLRLTKGWFVGFSFIYDVSKSRELYGLASEFLKSAQRDLLDGRYKPFVESLSIAFENLARARIYLFPDKEIRKAKTHRTVHAKVNIYSRTNSIIKTSQKDVFNRLSTLRGKARYDPGFRLSHAEAKKMLATVEEFGEGINTLLTRYG